MPPELVSVNASSRPRVLMLAFACEPDEGSEPEVGWKWAQVMADSCDITVITQSKNQPRIDAWIRNHLEQSFGIRFSYLELGPMWRWLKKRIPGGMYVYYTLWQWKLRGHAARLMKDHAFDLIHHVTFASFRMPVWVKGAPVVWGPVGGAEMALMPLLQGHGTFAGRLRERVRNVGTTLASSLVSCWEPTRRSGGIALASTPATARILKNHGIACQLHPTIGYDSDAPLSTPENATDNAALRLLFVGRLHLLKGLHLLLRALAGLRDQPVTLDIVGDGPEGLRLRKMVNDLDIGSSVNFHGHLARTELPKVFAAHHVVVAPSLYESGGLTVLEGFAQGRPAIVLDCGGHAISVDETCGIRIPMVPNQQAVIDSLIEAILIYVRDRSLVWQHGQAARARLQRIYGWDAKHTFMFQIYRSVLSRHKPE